MHSYGSAHTESEIGVRDDRQQSRADSFHSIGTSTVSSSLVAPVKRAEITEHAVETSRALVETTGNGVILRETTVGMVLAVAAATGNDG